MLRVYGFTNAHVLDGGLPRWLAEGRPVETGASPAALAPGNFTPAAPKPYVANRADMVAAVGAPGVRIINALRPEQYSGAERPRKGRPGHIPSSINVPAASLLDPSTNLLLDDEALRARFVEAGVTGHERVLAYCGGGVSASFIVFALMKLGYSNVLLYDASLAEWACDSALPMQTETNPV
jgi:thiosulfate/3-mercaptopyruvate sulfurtransferase